MAEPLSVLVVGAGLMGSQIGCEYALGGHSVTFLVRSLEPSRARVSSAFALAIEAGIAGQEAAADAVRRVSFVDTVDAVDSATELVVESIPEEIELKRAALRELAKLLPRAVIASNTSSIPLTELGAAIDAPERTVGTHYWNPPLLMPLVEIVAGEQTSRETIGLASRVVAGLGKEPVLVERDVPGFIWNRLQAALLREALWLAEEGVATPETIDRVMRSGLARRYRYTGPFETVALGGLASWTRVAENLFPHLSAAARPGAIEPWLYAGDEELDAVRLRRDRGLAEELAREREPEAELLSVDTVAGYLRARNVLPGDGDPTEAEELGGGVSNIVLAVYSGDTRVVVKQALPRLRVEEEWLAKRERALNEASALRLAGTITPGCVPDLVDVDAELCALTMSAAPAGWATWKQRLLAGDIDAAVAARLGEILAAWHSATFGNEEALGTSGDYEVFDQLRIDPYYRTVASWLPRLANPIASFVRRMEANRVCLVHGDYSPKNVLVGERVWVIDFEVVHFGDPAFDLAFMLNHLLLKRLHLGGPGAAIESCVKGFWNAYLGGISDMPAPDLEYVLGHVGCLMVARVDGKSPAEYLTPDERKAARAVGSRLLLEPPGSLEEALAVTAETAA
jgi:3-hydroxyacyl-CoA dehydrogenase/aminoglycoside phosphotransferase (APT) family kinase protein